jgi:glycosyltransferase involved in cell wall biosynthesis
VPSTFKAFLCDQLYFLSKNEYDISVITSSDAGGQDYYKKLPENFNYHFINISRKIKVHEDIKALYLIYRILTKNRFQIVQYATPKAALLGSIASWLARSPHRLYLMWGLYYVTQTGLKKLVFKYAEKLVCFLSTNITPDSHGNVRFAIQEQLCTKSKIGVIWNGSANGVNIDRFDPERLVGQRNVLRKAFCIPKDAFLFGTIAAIVRDKGINELVLAFERIAVKVESAYLLIIGRPTEKDPVEKRVSDIIANHKRIVNIGWQSEPEKFLASLDAFVLPTYREGFGVVNVEASSMALPVISTRVPGPNESIVNGKTGILVAPKNISQLENAMIRLIDNPEIASALGKAGRERVKCFYEQNQLWQKILQHRNALIQQC